MGHPNWSCLHFLRRDKNQLIREMSNVEIHQLECTADTLAIYQNEKKIAC